MHKPVLLAEILNYAKEINPRWILDCTFGRGGHTRAFLETFPEAKVVALDQDADAIRYGEATFAAPIADLRLRLKKFNFHAASELSENPPEGYELILLDLGVSSPQLDDSARGFSFYHDGPLDMRMNQTQELDAAQLVNTWAEVELLELFQKYGEVHRPQRVVRAILNDRKTSPYHSTLQLAQMIERVDGWQKKGHHPATRYFLALRMAVNQELSGLESCLPDLMRALHKNGRLMVITFHSLEDRIVKYAFRKATELGSPLFKRVVVPSDAEVQANPRARSAKLRVFQRRSEVDESSAFK